MSVVVGPPDGDMVAYLETLDRLRAITPLTRIFPGHGPPIDRPLEKLDALVRHRNMRITQVKQALSAGPATVEALVRRLYEGDIPDHLLGLAAVSVRGTLDLLERRGEVASDGDCFTAV